MSEDKDSGHAENRWRTFAPWLASALAVVLLFPACARGAFDVWFLRRFWRPFLVATAAALTASQLDGNKGTINFAAAGAAFAVSLPVFLVLKRRRRARGRLSLSEKALTRWDKHVEAGRDSPLFTGRPVAILLFLGVLFIGIGGPFIALVLFPEAMGQERWSAAGRLAGSAVGGFLVVGGLTVLVLLYGTLARAPFAASDPGTGTFPRRTSLAVYISVFGLSGVVIAAIFFASPAPTAAQRAADRARAAALRIAASRTRNVHVLGTRAADGEFVYSLRSIRAVAVLPRRSGRPERPRAGNSFVVAEVSVTNSSDRALPPFPFRGEGAFLIDGTARRYATDAEGANYAPIFVPAHGTRSLDLVFQVPAGRPVNGLVLWDVFDQADHSGGTYVYFRAGAAPAVRSIGPTATGG